MGVEMYGMEATDVMRIAETVCSQTDAPEGTVRRLVEVLSTCIEHMPASMETKTQHTTENAVALLSETPLEASIRADRLNRVFLGMGVPPQEREELLLMFPYIVVQQTPSEELVALQQGIGSILQVERIIDERDTTAFGMDATLPDIEHASPEHASPEHTLESVAESFAVSLAPLRRELQRVLDRMAGTEFHSFEVARETAQKVQSLMQHLGVRAECPKTGLPGNLRHRQAKRTKTGTFQIEIVEDGKRTSRFSSTTFPPIVLVAAPEDGRKA